MITMLTLNNFRREWQALHHPAMDTRGDVAFYHQVYRSLQDLLEREGFQVADSTLLSLLLYTESIAATGLDGVYEYLYRSVGDWVTRWCERQGLRASVTSRVQHLLSEAVADAPRSTLRQWIAESVLSEDFIRLHDTLTYITQRDQVLRLVYPTLEYRQTFFRQLTDNEEQARRLLWADMAFNWRDKRGNTIAQTLAHQFLLTASYMGKEEQIQAKQVADRLDSIHSLHLSLYEDRLTSRRFLAHLVTYQGKTHAITPTGIQSPATCRRCTHRRYKVVDKAHGRGTNAVATMCTSSASNEANKETITPEALQDFRNTWAAIEEKEQNAAKRKTFTTPFGQRLSLYEDLYAHPAEVSYLDLGIYQDEPNILDFLQSKP